MSATKEIDELINRLEELSMFSDSTCDQKDQEPGDVDDYGPSLPDCALSPGGVHVVYMQKVCYTPSIHAFNMFDPLYPMCVLSANGGSKGSYGSC